MLAQRTRRAGPGLAAIPKVVSVPRDLSMHFVLFTVRGSVVLKYCRQNLTQDYRHKRGRRAHTGKMQPGQPAMIDSALDRLQLELDDLATSTMFSLVWRHFCMR